MTHTSISMPPAAYPKVAWDYYVQYLWYYTPDSLVGRTAYAFRVLALLMALPFVVLTLLDIASYVIARTLGVVEGDSHSVSDKFAIPMRDVPSLTVSTPSETGSRASMSVLEGGDAAPSHPSHDMHPQAYLDSEDNVSQLSGVDVFSPAASRPPSPPSPTKGRPTLVASEMASDRDGTDESGLTRRKAKSTEED